jgi:hypothetical protein
MIMNMIYKFEKIKRFKIRNIQTDIEKFYGNETVNGDRQLSA